MARTRRTRRNSSHSLDNAPEWVQTAARELEEYEDLGEDHFQTARELGFDTDAYQLSGSSAYGEEWIVCEDEEDAIALAVESVEQSLTDEPESLWGEWANDFLTRDGPAVREFINNEVEAYIESMEDEDMLAEASLHEEYGDAEEDEDEDRMESLLYDAEGVARRQYRRRLEDELRSASAIVNYFKAHFGYDMADIFRTGLVSRDEKGAAEYAVSVDGAARTLAGYDGTPVDLDSGAVAFRTN